MASSDDGGSHRPIVVAVDKDKNSASAVKWAVDNLLASNPNLVLVHVRIKKSPNPVGGNEAAPDANGGSSNEGTQNVFTPFRAYSARKRIVVKEIVLEDNEVSKGLLDYINGHCVTNIVLGASSRSALGRKYWTPDVPTIINKAAPEFCTVYVVSKGRQQSVRPAAKPLTSSAPARQHFSSAWTPSRLSNSESEDISRLSFARAEPKIIESEKTRPEKGPSNVVMDHLHAPSGGPMNSCSRTSLSDGSELFARINHRSVDISADNLDFTQVAIKETPRNGSSSYSLEAEMKRLKLELRQTLDMYNAACKEAVLANQAAEELNKWKMEEARRFEQARLAEDAALAIAETEKAKCRAAIEAAKKAQKMVEIEAQRRKYAELKAKQEGEKKNRAMNVLSQNDLRYRKYTIEEIEAATKNFSSSLKVGEGGYGPVFKGKLDHTPVAIKVLSADAAQGKKQFQQEVEVLSLIRHPNLVLLLGACPEYGCLVYEFMNNGSLEDRLFQKGNTPSIPWEIRFKIAAEIATGLLFLHQAKPEPLVHRDLKPANILLDRNYVCKISDVGLARLVPPSVADTVTQYHMTSAAGTFCYIDPEYQQTGKLGTKSDIYSLGVMLLQIITARPPMGLTHHVERAIEKGTFADLLDPTVQHWPVEEALKFAKLSLKCAELRMKDRPDLGSVIVPELNKLKEVGINSMPSISS
ncbi:U-box domain-containing protein 35-like isoform X1 [Nicotiana tabacum]|uniref:U-box domain-containing protein 35-like isoform X1 n=1 Tax=Nicotiana tabacum TaxID=4097 RepID=A0A1S3Z2C8_TOBAC|nr:PREDICTED: U-box domain-containing protein 35-like isoform X1 [Nicotiana tabacum]